MALKKKQQESTGSGIDFNFVNSQVEDDTHEARISVIIDAGMQQPPTAVYDEKNNRENVMYFADEEEAQDYIDQAEDIVGSYVMEKEGYTDLEEEDVTKKIIQKYELDAEEGDVVYKTIFKIVTPKLREEVLYAVDLVDTTVQYKKDEEEEMQFRIWLNKRDFKTGVLNGFSTNFAPPLFNTFAVNSMHSVLANATGNSDILDPKHEDFGDLSLLLGEPLGIQTTQKANSKGDKEYINLKVAAPSRLPKKVLKLGVSELDCTPEAVDWEDVTVEQLMNILPNKLVIEKLKAATNYEGSQMQAALEEYEEIRKQEYANSQNSQEEDEDEAKPKAKANERNKKEEKKDNSKAKEETNKDDDDEDYPF